MGGDDHIRMSDSRGGVCRICEINMGYRSISDLAIVDVSRGKKVAEGVFTKGEIHFLVVTKRLSIGRE